MTEVLSELSRYPVKTRLSLTGTLVVARDIAHAKLKEQLDKGEGLPEYMMKYPVYYAGPAKTPEVCSFDSCSSFAPPLRLVVTHHLSVSCVIIQGYASGSFGPTTAGRMDTYVEEFQAAGGSMVMLAKGNRSKAVTKACKTHGGFYLGSIGGPAAVLAQNSIKKVEVLAYPELGRYKVVTTK